MKLNILICLLFFPMVSFGQNLTDSLLASFYNRTLLYYFSDSNAYRDQRKFGCVLVTTNFPRINLIKRNEAIQFKYFNKNTPMREVLVRPYRRNAARNFYKIYHKSIGNDTLDVNIDGSTFYKVTRKKLYIEGWCGGTMGYIPSGRFVYNKTTGNWTFITSKEIMEEKMKKPY